MGLNAEMTGLIFHRGFVGLGLRALGLRFFWGLGFRA